MKIYLVETTDMYGDTSCGDTGYLSEQEADRIMIEKTAKNHRNGYDFKVIELEIKYTHRNGESEIPVEAGYYWIEDKDIMNDEGEIEKFIFMDCLESHWREANRFEWRWYDDDPSEYARYWGPIPLPTFTK